MLLSSTNLPAQFRAGTLLQAHGNIVLTGTEVAVVVTPKVQPAFFFHLRLPILFHPNGQVVYPGIANPPGPIFYSRPQAALFALKEARYVDGQVSIGIGETPLEENYHSLLWGNPFIHGEAPYAANGIVLTDGNLELRTSALVDPSFVFLRYRWQGFGDSKVLALRTLQITPQLFGKFSDIYERGAGLQLKSTVLAFERSQLGLEHSVVVVQKNHLLWQQTSGFFWQFFTITYEGGVLAQSANHPYGPYLSHATVGRFALLPEDNLGLMGGVYLGLRSSVSRDSGFYLRSEYFGNRLVSLRFDYEQKQARASWALGFLREGMAILLGSLTAEEPNTFLVFKINYQAVGDFLLFFSENYYSYFNGLSYRSTLGLSWFF